MSTRAGPAQSLSQEPPTPPRLHVIIVQHNNAGWIEMCLAALMAQTQAPRQVTVFDNASSDDGPQRVESAFPSVHLMRSPERVGYAAAVDRAVAARRDAEIIVLLDAEAILALDAVERLAESFARHPMIAVMGCKVLDGDVETIYQVGMRMRGNGLPWPVGRGEADRGQYAGVIEVATVHGGAVAIRADAWCELGGLDDRFESPTYEQTDFCLRALAADWRIGVDCSATVTHFGLPDGRWAVPSDSPASFFRGRARFVRTHYGWGDWVRRFWPTELRWMVDRESGGQRLTACSALIHEALRKPRPNGHPRHTPRLNPWMKS